MHKQERKYFDSGDYALSKAGKASDIGVTQVGREHPNPENIPHSTSPHGPNLLNGHVLNPPGVVSGLGGSPVKESSYLQQETSAADIEQEAGAEPKTTEETSEEKTLDEQGSEHAENAPVAIQK